MILREGEIGNWNIYRRKGSKEERGLVKAREDSQERERGRKKEEE